MKTIKIEISDELYDRLYTDSRSIRILSIEECAAALIERGYEWRDVKSEGKCYCDCGTCSWCPNKGGE